MGHDIGRYLDIGLATFSYVIFHELGHFLFALFYDLGPMFAVGTEAMPVTGLSLLSIGIAYMPGTAIQEFLIVFGATILPLFIAGILYWMSKKWNDGRFRVMAEIYLIFIVLNLIPLGGFPQLDANKLWSFLGFA